LALNLAGNIMVHPATAMQELVVKVRKTKK
jgi:hypothetical protein